MKKTLLKFLICILSIITLFTATACGPDNGGIMGGGNTNIDENEDVEEITVFRNELESFNVARKQNSSIYQALKKAVGVDVKGITASTDWQTMLSKMYFDGSLPNIFLCSGPDSPDFFYDLIKNGDILPVSDYVNESTKDEYPNIYAVLERVSYLKNNLAYADGKIWALPSSWELEKSMYVRQDWIDNLNAKLAYCLVQENVISSESEYNAATMYEKYKYVVPTDLLEFYRLCRAFTLYDPDGNGKKDTYGYESETNLDMDAWIYVAFGAGWHAEMKDPKTGKYIASEVSEASMYATSFINRLLTEGYMSPNSLSNDNSGKQLSFSRGRTGMIFAHNWLGTFVMDMMDTYSISVDEALAKITMFDPPKGRDGHYGADGNYDNYWMFNCINANMSQKRIKACLKLFDFMYSDEGRELFTYGVEGIDYEYVLDEQGNKVVDEDFDDGRYKRNCLIEPNEKGIALIVGSRDTAYQLYSLGWWTGHYNNETTKINKIVAQRQLKSSQYGYKVDYPYIQTELYIKNIKGLRDYAEENFVEIMNDSKGKYWTDYLTSDEMADFVYNPDTFGWDDIYVLPRTIKTKWNSYVNAFNNDLKGGEVYAEYNAYIESGKAQKRTQEGPIYANCGAASGPYVD